MKTLGAGLATMERKKSFYSYNLTTCAVGRHLIVVQETGNGGVRLERDSVCGTRRHKQVEKMGESCCVLEL